jgi:solute carrier family 25 phosphate transporter 3
MSPRVNPFFSTPNFFFAQSVGDKVDGAIAQGKQIAKDAQAQGDKLYNKVQDAKEAVKDSASDLPTGIDLYSR